MTGPNQKTSLSGILLIFLRLGVTSFGGPTAHIGYYREAFVKRRQWLTDQTFADLLAVAQLLPGPTSTQIAMSIGALRAGVPGAVAAWVGFCMPSAVLMIAFAFGIATFEQASTAGWLAGLKLAALAVVANAVLGMARTLAPDRERATIALAAVATVILLPGILGQLAAIAIGVLAGITLFRTETPNEGGALPDLIGRRAGTLLLSVFVIVLVALALIAQLSDVPWVRAVDGLYRAGALVFGGGHVVLPLLEAVVVPPGWLDQETFVAGYGAAQALPGPIFAIAAFLGASMASGLAGLALGFACLVAIFLPGFLLVLGVLPFWGALRGKKAVRAALTGVNAAVVGLLGAALYDPVWTTAVATPLDFALALAGFVALNQWRVPSWAVVIVLAVFGGLIAA